MKLLAWLMAFVAGAYTVSMFQAMRGVDWRIGVVALVVFSSMLIHNGMLKDKKPSV